MAEIKMQEMLRDLAIILEQFHQVSQKDYSELCRLSELLAQKEALLEAFAGRERENQRQVKALEDQLNKVRLDYRNDLEKKEHAYQLLAAAKNKAEQEIAKVNTNMAFVISYEKALKELDENLNKKSKELQARETAVESREFKCQQIEKTNETLKDDNGLLKAEIDKVNGLRQQEKADFQTKLAAKDKETSELDDKLQGKIREYDELANEYKAVYQASEAWQKKCADIEADAKEYKELFDAAEDEKEELKNNYDTLNSKYTALQAEQEKLENESKKLREQSQQASAPVEEAKPKVNSKPEVAQQEIKVPQPKSKQKEGAVTDGKNKDSEGRPSGENFYNAQKRAAVKEGKKKPEKQRTRESTVSQEENNFEPIEPDA